MKKSCLIISLFCAHELLANDNYTINKNYEVIVNSKTMKVRENPFVDSNVLYSKKRDDKFKINGCNIYGWCQLESGGYAPDFLLYAKDFKSNFKKEFNNNKNSFALVKTDKLNVYDKPSINSNVALVKERNDLLEINGCDDFGWCELKDEGYIKSFLTQKKQKDNTVTKEEATIEEVPPVKELDINAQENKNLQEKVEKKENPIIDKYKIALTYYKNKDYENSYIVFKSLFEENLNDVNTNFYLGRSAFELKKYNEALGAYERVLFERPDAIRTKYEMARTFFVVNDLKNSKKLFEELLKEDNLQDKIKSNIKKYLEAIEKRTNRHLFSGAFIFGINYDSNINNASDEKVFENVYIPQLNTTQNLNNTTVDDSDFSHEEVLNLNYTYLINDKQNISNNFLIFAKSMFEYDEKNTLFFSYNPSFNHIINSELQTSYGLFVDNLRLDNNNYIISYGINPKIDYSLNSTNKLTTTLKYQKKSYQQEADKNKNSTYTELKISNKHIFDEKNIIRLEALLAQEKKDKNVLSINNKQYGLKLIDLYLYQNNITISPAISYVITKYDDENKNYLKKENTQKLKLELSSNYLYNKNLIFKASSFYEDSKSNIPTSQYNKYGININLIRPF